MSTDQSHARPDDAESGDQKAAPGSSALDRDFEHLEELGRTGEARVYLARHRALNRDVTITVLHAEPGDVAAQSALSQIASDARSLVAMRHANVVPVLEGRWLDGNNTFAIVRARVRGSTLRAMLDESGPMSPNRVAHTLRQVHGALVWARVNGIGHRHVSPDGLLFQQGSGRVLLALDPSPAGRNAPPNACDDARALGRLAIDMLAGSTDTVDATALAARRPELPREIVARADAIVRCDTGGPPPDVEAFLAALDDSSGATPSPGVPSTNSDMEIPISVAGAAAASTASPTDADGAVVVVRRRGMGFTARVATTAIVISAVIVGGLFLVRHRPRGFRAGGVPVDTTQFGDISLRQRRPDTAVIDTPIMPVPLAAPMPNPGPVSSAVTTPPPAYVPPGATPNAAAGTPPNGAPGTGAATSTSAMSPITPPPESLRVAPDSLNRPQRVPQATPGVETRPTTPIVRYPSPVTASADSLVAPPSPNKPVSASGSNAPPTASAAAGDPCGSSAAADQRVCVVAAITRSDRDVDAALGRVIGALRRQVNAVPSDPDPPSVARLRDEQQRWRDDRDRACRDAGVAPYFALARAQCYSEHAASRARSLQQMLDSLPQRDPAARPDTTVRRDTTTRL